MHLTTMRMKAICQLDIKNEEQATVARRSTSIRTNSRKGHLARRDARGCDSARFGRKRLDASDALARKRKCQESATWQIGPW